MKSFYSYLDAGYSVPAWLQHLAIKQIAERAGGKIVFYGSEEAKTLRSQAFMRSKLGRLTDVHGICFFSFHQCRYGESIDWDLLKKILGAGLEIHFAREGLSLLTPDDLSKHHTFLYSVDFTLRPEIAQVWLGRIPPLAGG